MDYLARNIIKHRKALALTQQQLAEKLSVSGQTVSKWENSQTMPDIMLLPEIAAVFGISTDALLGYMPQKKQATIYEELYQSKDYYWGTLPSGMCMKILTLRPPTREIKVLDIGCGEGANLVFLAQNGYRVTGFDIADAALEKTRRLAYERGVQVTTFKADVREFVPDEEYSNLTFCSSQSPPQKPHIPKLLVAALGLQKVKLLYDVIFSSGVLHYLTPDLRAEIIGQYKRRTRPEGIHFLNVFVEKPFISPAPDNESTDFPWLSGELMGYYHDWFFHEAGEAVFDCMSSGVPHKHCMNSIVAEKR